MDVFTGKIVCYQTHLNVSSFLILEPFSSIELSCCLHAISVCSQISSITLNKTSFTDLTLSWSSVSVAWRGWKKRKDETFVKRFATKCYHVSVVKIILIVPKSAILFFIGKKEVLQSVLDKFFILYLWCDRCQGRMFVEFVQ